MSGEYTCDQCGGVFTPHDDWTDDDATEEAVKTFGERIPDDQVAVVCDDCYEEIMKVWKAFG